jgi:hypothetical protein
MYRVLILMISLIIALSIMNYYIDPSQPIGPGALGSPVIGICLIVAAYLFFTKEPAFPRNAYVNRRGRVRSARDPAIEYIVDEGEWHPFAR